METEIIISGVVQGVFFRASGLAEATRLGLKCRAENKSDETVYFQIAGKKESIDKFIAWCHIGPPLAKVTNVAVTWLNSN